MSKQNLVYMKTTNTVCSRLKDRLSFLVAGQLVDGDNYPPTACRTQMMEMYSKRECPLTEMSDPATIGSKEYLKA